MCDEQIKCVHAYILCSDMGCFNIEYEIYSHMNVLFPQLFQRKGYDFNASNNVRDILYNTAVINSVVKNCS